MMFIRWSSSLETGQPLIDAEHKLLVMLFRKLDVAIKSHLPEDTVKQVILEVRRFVEFHFESEENLMRETRYPGVKAHQDRHVELLTELSSRLSKLSAHREFADEMLYFLNDWLIKHISSEDQHVAKHVRKSAARPIAEFTYHEYLDSPDSGSGSDT